MKLLQAFKLSFFFLILISANNYSQTNSKYNQHDVFDPTFLIAPGTAYRSGSGMPGPAYWQNKADYVIKVKLEFPVM